MIKQVGSTMVNGLTMVDGENDGYLLAALMTTTGWLLVGYWLRIVK